MWTRFHHRTAVSLLLLLVFAAGARAEVKVGEPLPAMLLEDASTRTETDVGVLLKGSVGAIVYMQTSCAACRKELQALKELQANTPELKIVAVSVDAGEPERVQKYKEHFGFEFPFLRDPEFRTPEFFGFSFTPGLVLVARNGNIAYVKGGYRPGDESVVQKKVVELLTRP